MARKRFSLPDNKSLILLAILLLGCGLRLTGIRWGLPNSRYFDAQSHFVDERNVLNEIRASASSELFKPPKVSYVFLRGSIPTYWTAACIGAGWALGRIAVKKDFGFYKENPWELAKLYLAGRFGVLFFSLLTILLAFWVGARFYGGPEVGLLAALLLAIIPAHVIYSHFIQADSFAAFGVLAVLYTSLRLRELWRGTSAPRRRDYFWVGLCVGFAAQSKFSAGLTGVMPLIVHFSSARRRPASHGLLGYLVLGTAAAFFAFNPHALLSPKDLLDGVARMSHGVTMIDDNVLGFWYGKGLWSSLGLPLYLVLLAAVVHALFFERKYETSLLLAFTAVFWLGLYRISFPFVRYVLMLMPVIALLLARSYWSLHCARKINPWARRTAQAFFAAACLYAAGFSWTYVRTMSEKDVRDAASDYIAENIPPGATIGIPAMPFHAEPTIIMTQWWYPPERSENKVLYQGIPRYKLRSVSTSVKKLRELRPQYFVMSEWTYFPNHVPFSEREGWHQRAVDKFPLARELFSGKDYQLIKSFDKSVRFLGLPLRSSFIPSDLRTVLPAIHIFERKDS